MTVTLIPNRRSTKAGPDGGGGDRRPTTFSIIYRDGSFSCRCCIIDVIRFLPFILLLLTASSSSSLVAAASDANDDGIVADASRQQTFPRRHLLQYRHHLQQRTDYAADASSFVAPAINQTFRQTTLTTAAKDAAAADRHYHLKNPLPTFALPSPSKARRGKRRRGGARLTAANDRDERVNDDDEGDTSPRKYQGIGGGAQSAATAAKQSAAAFFLQMSKESRDKMLKSSKDALIVTKKSYLKKDWCKTEPLIQRVREPGCVTRTVVNRFCYGQCNSFYIPKNTKRDLESSSFKSCSFCKPKRFRWITITLNCPGRNPPYKKKRIQRIKKCKCMSEILQ